MPVQTSNVTPKQSVVRSSIAFLGVIAPLALGAAWLLDTNPTVGSWAQGYDPVGRWWLSTALAGLPIVVLLGAMAGLRLKAHLAAVLGLSTALAVAIGVFHMPARLALTAAVSGAGYGTFPIYWIVLPVIFLYNLTVKTGTFVALKESLANFTDDSRLQLLLIAFAFGAFFEGSAGFGTPLAVCGAILVSLGFAPLEAACLTLLCDTAPVAFGALGIPTVTLHALTGLDTILLSRTISAILRPFCIMVPFWTIWMFAGFQATIEVWPAALVTGGTFALGQYLMATHFGPTLADMVAASCSMVALVVFLRFWKPKRVLNARRVDITAQARQRTHQHDREVLRAWMPWLILCVVVFIWGLPQFTDWLDARTTIKIAVPGLDQVVHRVPPVVPKQTTEAAVFTFDWLTATGTGITVAAVLAGLMMGLSVKTLATEFFRALFHTRFTMVTIAAMLAIGYVTRYCGLDATMGLAFARTGSLYPFFGTLIGWLGVASTGSDTSSNVLFGSLQTMTARQIGVSPLLMASANAGGGVMGKMISASSIVVASTATETYGQEGAILRRVILHSIVLAALVGVVVYLMAYVEPFTALVAR